MIDSIAPKFASDEKKKKQGSYLVPWSVVSKTPKANPQIVGSRGPIIMQH